MPNGVPMPGVPADAASGGCFSGSVLPRSNHCYLRAGFPSLTRGTRRARSVVMSFASVRNASFTISESENTAATSGSSTIAVAPAANREAYGFRLAPRKSYSGRMSSGAVFGRERERLEIVFFIGLALASSGAAGAEDSHSILAAFREHNNQEPILGRPPDNDESVFASRVLPITAHAGERASEDRQRFEKTDAMKMLVAPFLVGIPFECKNHRASLWPMVCVPVTVSLRPQAFEMREFTPQLRESMRGSWPRRLTESTRPVLRRPYPSALITETKSILAPETAGTELATPATIMSSTATPTSVTASVGDTL